MTPTPSRLRDLLFSLAGPPSIIIMPRRRPPNPDAPASARLRGIEKKAYMTRDAARRLRQAKRAARAVLTDGGTAEQAAVAAQSFGTPCEGESSDEDESEDSDGAAAADADALSKAIDELAVSTCADAAGPSAPAPLLSTSASSADSAEAAARGAPSAPVELT